MSNLAARKYLSNAGPRGHDPAFILSGLFQQQRINAMGLVSRLFQGNKKLEACLVDNAAHVTQGAQGEHVAKIQLALFSLDALQIDRTELVTQTYGPSTAAAVLSYKTKRQIINKSYQTTPDSIVGKMTITSLDAEMRDRQLSFPSVGDCALTPPSVPQPFVLNPLNGPQGPVAAFAGQVGNSTQSGGVKQRQLNRVLRIFLAITRKASLEDGFPSLSADLERTKDSLFEHGLTLSVEFRNGFADTIDFPGTAGRVTLEDDIIGLRKASEDVRPGLANILRVIVCPMNDFVFGETFRNRSIGNLFFPPFVLLNSRQIDRSHATLLHEMIHAAFVVVGRATLDHDKERNSIFFENGTSQLGAVNRTFLKPDHAAILAKGFFAV